MSPETAALEVTDATFATEVLGRSAVQPVVVDFWAPWCGPCRVLGPIIEQVAATHGDDVRLVKLNTDENPRTATTYGIQSIPAVKAFRDGKIAAEFTGALPEEQVRAFFARLVPSEAEKLAADGLRLLDSDPTAAEARFREALSKGPSADAVVGLASILLQRGETDEASVLLDRAPADRRAKVMKHRIFLDDFAARNDEGEIEAEAAAEPSSPRARYRWGVLLAAAGRYEPALDELLESVRLDRQFADGAARKAALAVFDLIGLESPVTREYQRKLSMLLF